MNLKDRTAIENLIFRYARSVDEADYETLGSLFTHAKITANKTDEVLETSARISEYWRSSNKRYECGTPRTHHVVSNLEFDTDAEDRIRVRSYFTVFQQTAKLPLQPIACGRYDDRFERSPDGWRFGSKHIEVTLLGNMAEHLNIDIG